MKNIGSFLYVFICLCNVSFAVSQDESFEEMIMRLDFVVASEKAKELDQKESFPYHSYISSLFAHSGQFREKDVEIYNVFKNLDGKDAVLGPFVKGLYLLYNEAENDKAFTNLIQALNLAKEHNKDILPLVYLALLELYGQEIVQSTSNYFEYLEEFKNISESSIIQDWYSVHRIRYFSKSNQGDFSNIFLCEFQVFEKYFNEHVATFPESLKGYYYYYRAIYFRNLKESKKAEFALKKLVNDYGDKIHYRYMNFISNLFLCDITANKNEFELAKKHLETAKKYWNKSDVIRSQYIQRRYSAFYYYEKLDRYEDGFDLLKGSILDESQLDFRNNTFLMSETNLKFQTAEKEKTILEQEKSLLLEKEQKTKSKNLAIGLGITLVLSSLIGILLYLNGKRKHRITEQQEEIQRQKVETLLKEQELVSIDAMIAGQEKERTKVANELHDDLGSLMATVKLHFDNVKVDEKDPAMKSAQDLLEKAYQKIRGMAHAKNSGVMANQGLLPAVQKMARTINETRALEVSVEDFGLADRMENSLELTIFRILQELITNIIKHAEATKASIQFTQHEDNMNIIVEDNGKGFDMSTVKRTASGMGLGTIEKRIEHLEGSFTVDSVLGKGTSILIDIPV